MPKRYKLTYSQDLEIYKGRHIRIKRGGNVYYVGKEFGALRVYNWIGETVTNVEFYGVDFNVVDDSWESY